MLEVTIMWESEHRSLGALASLWEHVILGKAGGPVLEHGHCWTSTADPCSGFGEQPRTRSQKMLLCTRTLLRESASRSQILLSSDQHSLEVSLPAYKLGMSNLSQHSYILNGIRPNHLQTIPMVPVGIINLVITFKNIHWGHFLLETLEQNSILVFFCHRIIHVSRIAEGFCRFLLNVQDCVKGPEIFEICFKLFLPQTQTSIFSKMFMQ